MSVAFIKIRPEPAYRREAIASGLQRIGFQINTDPRAVPDGAGDLLVLWNRKAGAEETLAENWERRFGGTVLVIENGYLAKTEKTHYAISVGEHNGAGWFPVGDDERFSRLGFAIKDRPGASGRTILVIGQRGIGSSLMRSPPQWGEKMAAKWKAQGAVLRPHPGNFKPRVPLEVDLAKAGNVLIWSSSAGVRAMVEGIPVQHYAPHWICAAPVGTPIERRLERMAHGQWSVDEIASGEPFARMKAFNWGV